MKEDTMENVVDKLKKVTELFAQDDLAGAKSLLENLVQGHPEVDEIYPFLCKIQILTNQYDFPVEWIIRGIKADDNLNNMFTGLAGELFEKEMPEVALRFLLAVVEASPQNFEAYNDIGVILCSSGDLDQAGEFIQKSLDINPDYTEAIINQSKLNNLFNSETS